MWHTDPSKLPSTSQLAPHQAQPVPPQMPTLAASALPSTQPSSQASASSLHEQLPRTSQPAATPRQYNARDSFRQPPGQQNAPRSRQDASHGSATARGLSGQRAEPKQRTTEGFGLQAGTASDDLAFLASLIAGEEVPAAFAYCEKVPSACHCRVLLVTGRSSLLQADQLNACAPQSQRQPASDSELYRLQQ